MLKRIPLTEEQMFKKITKILTEWLISDYRVTIEELSRTIIKFLREYELE